MVFPDSVAQAVCALTTEDAAPLPEPPHADISNEAVMAATATCACVVENSQQSCDVLFASDF